MKIDFISEPELEFGAGARHIDIRFGLMNYGPLDQGLATAPDVIRIGLVGTPESVDGFSAWIDTCRAGVPAKISKQPNLFPRFPGFGPGEPLHADVVLDSTLTRTIRERDVQAACETPTVNDTVEQATAMFLDELEALTAKGTANVLFCAVPFTLLKRMLAPESADDVSSSATVGADLDFHDMLKAKAMRFGVPLQLIQPGTYDETKRLRQVKRDALRKPQDEATRAWNLYAGLYYKAGGVPWRLIREATQLTVCYVGVSFYETLDATALMTSSAQVFNERGEGVILRGGAATVSKEDRQPHLDADGAAELLNNALRLYRGEHKTLPARVFLCKTSSFDSQELAGFRSALEKHGIDAASMVSIRGSHTRLFRQGAYPPLRGTYLTKDEFRQVLYTRGSVDFYETYPGMYVPRPLSITIASSDEPPKALASELLALTKLNWNNTQFDNTQPIVAAAARNVGQILKYLPASVSPQTRYSFYM